MEVSRGDGGQPGVTEQVGSNGQDPALRPRAEMKGMDATARHTDQCGGRHLGFYAIKTHLCMTVCYHQDLEYALMRVRGDDPIIQCRTRRNIFDMQEFRRDGRASFAIERETRDIFSGGIHRINFTALIEKCNSLFQSCLASQSGMHH